MASSKAGLRSWDGPDARERLRSADPVTVVAATSLADEIASRLAESILSGEYRPGDRIMQDEICTRYGVSRTPVREALRKLQAQNLVVVSPNRGATIRIPTKSELEEGWAIRAELEGFAVELACANLTDDVLRELDTAQRSIETGVKQLRRARPGSDEEARADAAIRWGNEDFHGVILRTAQNEQLRVFCEGLQSYLPKDYYWRAVRYAHAEDQLTVEQHRAIREALGRRNKRMARAAMRAHLLSGRDTLLAYLSAQGFWDD